MLRGETIAAGSEIITELMYTLGGRNGIYAKRGIHIGTTGL
jgi:hypothetical protein